MSPFASALLFWADEATADLLVRCPWLLRLLPRGPVGTYVRARTDHYSAHQLEAMAVKAPPWLQCKLWRIAGGDRGDVDDAVKARQLVLRAAAAEAWPAYRYEALTYAGTLLVLEGSYQEARRELTAVHDWFAARPVVRRLMRRYWHYTNYFLWAATSELGDEEAAKRHAWAAWAAGNAEDRAELEPHLRRPAPT